jgi:Single-stranded DNA binding protein Ssb-like, OB fold
LRQKKSTLGEHLALVSVKYNVYPSEVVQALITAKEAGKSTCGDLSVEYRGKVKDETIFLIKKENSVVAQFKVDEEFLSRSNDTTFENYMATDKIRKKIAKQNTDTVFSMISELRSGMKRINLKAKVLEIPKPAQVHTQFGNTAMVVNALIGDETGTIKLCLWEGQINTVALSDEIEIRNAQVCLFRGEKQLRLGKNGGLTVLNPTQAAPTIVAK